MKKRILALCLCCASLFPAPACATEPVHPFQQKMAQRRQAIAAASVCAERPRSEGELFALAMREYWRREMRALWRLDAGLNRAYPRAGGGLDVTDRDCGLVRDAAGGPLRMDRETCLPWRLKSYDTLDKLAERLKAAPEFGAVRDFDQPGRQQGGWIYDAIVRDLLHGESCRPDGASPYLPAHNGQAPFAVLHKRGPAVRWYGPDCCRLTGIEEGEREARRLRRQGHSTRINLVGEKSLPPGLALEDLHYLRVSYREVDFNLASGRGGVGALAKGAIDDFDLYVSKYFLVSPCGVIVCLGDRVPCE